MYAFHTVLATAAEQLGTPASELVGGRVDEYIAKQVEVQGGGHPQPRQIRRVVARCQEPGWYPGKRTAARQGAGRPPQYILSIKSKKLLGLQLISSGAS